MATSLVDVSGSIVTYDFKIRIGVPSLSADKTQIVIPYTGFRNPASTANLTTYKYSMDNGTTWEDMTPSVGTVLTGLSFTVAGNSLTFTWEAKTDISTLMYNTDIRVKIGATSGALVTSDAMYNLYFERVTTNAITAASESVYFPNDYKGIPGTDLLVNAPKA